MDAIKKRKHIQNWTYTPPPLRWTDEIRMMVATYLNVNYAQFQALGENGLSKMDFLRKMRNKLKLVCTDKQLKNAFETMMRRYKNVRDKLKLGGFALLTGESGYQKDVVLQECPYYEILDEVMGDNDDTPYIFNSAAYGAIGDNSSVPELISSEPDTSLDMTIEHESAVSPNAKMMTIEDDFENYDDNDIRPNTSKKFKIDLGCDVDMKRTHNLVRPMMNGLVVKINKDTPKDSLGAFTEQMKEIETNKLNLEKEKFSFHKELEIQKLQHRVAKLQAALKTKEMEHNFELEKIKTMGEVDVQKLQLQIELEKLRCQKEPKEP